MSVLSVLLPLALDTPYSYLSPSPLPRGTWVKVPLQSREIEGIVWGQGEPHPKLKNLSNAYDLPPLPPSLCDFLDWMADYTLSPRGMLLKMAMLEPENLLKETLKIGVRLTEQRPKRSTAQRERVIEFLKDGRVWAKAECVRESGVSLAVLNALVDEGVVETLSLKTLPLPHMQADFAPPTLSQDQAEAAKELCAMQGFEVMLLEGLTGSGKTETYMEAIAQSLLEGKQSLVLMPEIALTPSFMTRFEARFGQKPLVWHSQLTPAQRVKTYKHLQAGEGGVVIGARSSLFLPFKNLGLIVVDEEHEASYKQEEGVRYHARDMAVMRGKFENCPVILASATPSVESYFNAKQGKYGHVFLASRFSKTALAKTSLLDMRGQKLPFGTLLSPRLVETVTQTLEKGEQALLFLNRRGFAPVTLCKGCGDKVTCPSCSANLVDHRFKGRLMCHYCGYSLRPPLKCTSCQGESFTSIGMGVERLAGEVAGKFPNKRILILSSDMAGGVKRLNEEIQAIEAGEIDILIGTQVVAKGHHFKNLGLVGVLDADFTLSLSDPRGGEKTYQLLQQVTGRAGRELEGSLALLQTHTPDHPVLQAIVKQDRKAFYESELQARQAGKLPPFGRLAALIVSANNENEAMRYATHLVKLAPADLKVLGPTQAPLYKLNNRFRVRILIKATKETPLSRLLREWLAKTQKMKGSLKLEIDIDPQNFL